MIDWKKYADHIFCIHYLPNNRLEKISKTLTDIGIDINDNKFFSFMYDIEHKIFQYERNFMYQKSFYVISNYKKFNKFAKEPYLFDVGVTTYRILKIAQHFKYEKIILFEDDLIFLKDHNYIIKALDFVNTQEFDLCSCQTTYLDKSRGDKNIYIKNGFAEDVGNDMFIRIKDNLGCYGGGFYILTKNAINIIVDFFEKNNVLTCIDNLEGLRHIVKMNILLALKPLCIQERMLNWNEKTTENINIKLDEYI